MKDVEEILKKADFTQGSNHKEKLRELLFSEGSLDKKDCELSDEELDLAAAGKIIADDMNRYFQTAAFLAAAGVALHKGWK